MPIKTKNVVIKIVANATVVYPTRLLNCNEKNYQVIIHFFE